MQNGIEGRQHVVRQEKILAEGGTNNERTGKDAGCN